MTSFSACAWKVEISFNSSLGSGIFKSTDPAKRAKAIVAAVTHYNDYKILAEVSRDLGEAMPGLEISTIAPEQRMQERGW